MEGIIDIDKSKDLDRCKKLIKNMVNDELADDMWDLLTMEIMDTSLLIGGDFSNDNIKNLTKQYIDLNGINRFKKAHTGEI